MLTCDDIILFQGDSITDAGRDRELGGQPDYKNTAAALGQGYPGKVGGRLLADIPGITVYNRGVSGNQITDLADRWQEDALNLKPTVLSILIGINDTGWGIPETGNSPEKFRLVYQQLLDLTKARLPLVKLVICEPFSTQTGAVVELDFQKEVDERRMIVRDLARDYDAVWVPFHSMFERQVNRANASYWAYDGVHPTAAAHQLMADLWLQRFQVE